MLQWLIEEAAITTDTAELDPMNVAGNLLIFNLFAEYRTLNTLSTVLSDLLCFRHFPSIVPKLGQSRMSYVEGHAPALEDALWLWTHERTAKLPGSWCASHTVRGYNGQNQPSIPGEWTLTMGSLGQAPAKRHTKPLTPEGRFLGPVEVHLQVCCQSLSCTTLRRTCTSTGTRP